MFLKRFPAVKQNRAQWAIFLELYAQWVIFRLKEKFAGLGGVKGGSHEYILHTGSYLVLMGHPASSQGDHLDRVHSDQMVLKMIRRGRQVR
jgi:hypothetical protein